jgi:aldehyde dehydrogenase (NAD+)
MDGTRGKMFVAGSWQAVSGGVLSVVDPATGEPWAEIGRGSAQDVDQAVASAQEALAGPWGRTPPAQRGAVLLRISQLIRENQQELSALESRNTGKPKGQAEADITACARYFEFYAGAADKVHGETIPYDPAFLVAVVRETHGVTGHILPWNYPAQMMGRSVAPAFAMGNACVVKPAEEACLSMLQLAALAAEAGLPPGALNVVPGLGEEAGAALSAHAGVAFMSFTGSPEIGTEIQKACAQRQAPCTLELGGKSPQVLFADADLESAIPAVVRGIVYNAGQTCSAGSRLLVEQGIWDAVVERLQQAFAALRVGRPQDNPDCGPLISAKQKERVQGFLELARRDGIAVVAQASIPKDLPQGGHYVAPTVLGPVPPEHPLVQEEIFGPVLVMQPFEDEAQAVALANGTAYGLMAGVWTKDGGRQLRLARAIRAGQVLVNNFGAGGGVELPFGGVKKSGHGREKGLAACHDFSVTKTIVIRHG